MDFQTENEINEFTIQKTRVRNRPSHNYNFLRKLLVYAKSIQPVMSTDVEQRLNQFWEKGKIQGAVTTRTYDSIFRIAEAQARLNLSEEVTDDIATQAMDSISLMLLQYGKVVQTIQSPRDAAYNTFMDILKHTSIGITITELCSRACKENKQISVYLGEKWNIERNHKLRIVIEMLLNHAKIRQVNAKPMVLQYFHEASSDTSDIYDTTTKASQNSLIQSKTDVSDIYDTTSANMNTLPAFMTEDKNHLLSDLSDIYDSTATSINKSADVSINIQNHGLSDLSDTYDTAADLQVNSEQESRYIYRLGHSDTWACENCRQKGDVHYMGKHLCKGVTKKSSSN
jgi:hypothetical protein